MEQYDDYFRKIHITGAGVCNVYKYFDARNRVCLGQLHEGELCGETSILFDSDPQYSIEGQSYCTIGTIEEVNMNKFLGNNPKVRQIMIDKIINNHFDENREDFVRLCKENIEFLKHFKSKDLRELYYSCMHLFLNPAQVLFEAGEVCDAIYIVLAGTLDVELTDGFAN
jgi:CRP-like cAMP-binding protein